MTITQLSLSYRHFLTFTSPCRYPRHSLLSVITPGNPSAVAANPQDVRSSRSMTKEITVYVPLGRSGATEQGIQYLYQLQEASEMSV